MSEESQDKEDAMVIDVNEDGVNSATTTSSTRPQQQPQAGMSESSSESREPGESPHIQQDSSTVFRFMYSPESLGLGSLHNSGSAMGVPAQPKGEKRTFSSTDNANTNRKTEADMKILTSYLKSVGESRAPEDIPPAILDKHLSTFFMGVKKYDGTEYEPCSLRAMLASIERYLRSKNYKVSLTRDVAFSGMRSHLKLKQMKLKGAKVDAVMCKQERLDKLYSSQKLGPFSPESVMFSLCFAICTYLKMKKLSEHKRLLWGDIILCKDGTGEEYLTFSNQFLTKANIITRYNFKHSKLKIPSETRNPERDSVGIYKLYCEKRPPAYNYPTAPFYLGTAVPGSTNVLGSWYRPIGLGVNKLNEFVRWSRELIGTVPSSRPAAAASATAAASSSTSGKEDESSQLSNDGGRLSDHTSLIPIAMQQQQQQQQLQQQLQQQQQAALQNDTMDSSELMENGVPDYMRHQPQDFHQDEVHVIDSEEEEDENFDDNSQVSAAYAEDFSSNSGVSAETSPIMYVQPCSPDYIPPPPAPEQPQPEDSHLGGGRFITVETAKQHLATILQHLDLSDLVTFDQWLKTMKISRDPATGQIFCRDNLHGAEHGLQVSATYNNTTTTNVVNSNSSSSGYGSPQTNGLGHSGGPTITLNISLSPQSLVGEGPVTVTALSRGATPTSTPTPTPIPLLGGFSSAPVQPTPPPPPPPAHQNPITTREPAVEAVVMSDRRLKRKPAFPIHLHAAARRLEGKSTQGGYKMLSQSRVSMMKAPAIVSRPIVNSPYHLSTSSRPWHIPSQYSAPISADKHDDLPSTVKQEKI